MPTDLPKCNVPNSASTAFAFVPVSPVKTLTLPKGICNIMHTHFTFFDGT